jgi:hypothetical protein
MFVTRLSRFICNWKYIGYMYAHAILCQIKIMLCYVMLCYVKWYENRIYDDLRTNDQNKMYNDIGKTIGIADKIHGVGKLLF